MRKLFINILVLLVSAVISLLLLEWVARRFLHLGNTYPNSSVWYKEKWLEDHEHNNDSLSGYAIDRYDSVLGWTLKENLDNCDVFGWHVSSNSLGCRGRQEFTYSRNNKLRILTIGDSFMFGECNEDTQTIPYYIGLNFDSVEVINMAVHGYGHDQILLRFQQQGIRFQPDIVLLGFLNDDINRNRLSFRDYAKPYFTVQNDELLLHGVPVPQPHALLQQKRIKSWALVNAYLDGSRVEDYDAATDSLTLKIFDRLSFLCDSIHSKLVIAYFPWTDECSANKPWHPLLDTIALRHNIPVLDPTQNMYSFLQTQDSTVSHFQCHYSPALSKVIASYFSAELKKLVAN